MTEQQAMRMALEALEIVADGGGVNFYEYAKDLRQALEQKPSEQGETHDLAFSTFSQSKTQRLSQA